MPLYIPRFGGHSEKPPLGSMVDPGHPLSKDLVVCALFNEGGGINLHNAANPYIVGVADSPSHVVWSNHIISSGNLCGRIAGPSAYSGSGPGIGMFDFGSDPKYFENMASWSVGVIAGFVSDTFQAHTAIALATGTAANQEVFQIRNNAASPAKWEFVTSNGTSYITMLMNSIDGSSGNGQASPEFPVFTFDGSTIRGYLNGLFQASTAASGLSNPAGAHLTIGNIVGGNSLYPWNSQLFAAYVWRRQLTASEVQWLYIEPWAMIRRAPASGIGSRTSVGGGGGGSVIAARRTLEQFGTRAGSRQMQWR